MLIMILQNAPTLVNVNKRGPLLIQTDPILLYIKKTIIVLGSYKETAIYT